MHTSLPVSVMYRYSVYRYRQGVDTQWETLFPIAHQSAVLCRAGAWCHACRLWMTPTVTDTLILVINVIVLCSAMQSTGDIHCR